MTIEKSVCRNMHYYIISEVCVWGTYDRSLLFSSSRRCPVERRSSSTPTPPRTAAPDRWHAPSTSHTYTCRRRI